MRYVMENGAKGVEVVISGKLRAARAKAMKFRDGYMIKSGDAVNHYIDFAVRHIQLKQVNMQNNTTARRRSSALPFSAFHCAHLVCSPCLCSCVCVAL